MTALDVYFIALLDDIAILLCILSLFGFFVAWSSVITYYETNNTCFLKVIKWSVVIAVGSCIVNTFIPSSKTALAMYTVPPVLEAVQTNKELQKLPDNAVKFVNMWLEENTKDKEK